MCREEACLEQKWRLTRVTPDSKGGVWSDLITGDSESVPRSFLFFRKEGVLLHRALYRKWRPQTFDDVCGQDHITDILKYEVANNKTSHAYLFCGSRGTGKTSCAKILSKAVNCLSPVDGNPCNACAACRSIDMGTATDVVEMDAASNTGVDNVRDIKDEIVFTPAELSRRVYIIDEVHMLSASAFNALLKTLEEPPAHVLFILATTELHKLPSTIVSRCQRFDFRRIHSDVLTRRLMQIAKAEGISLEAEGAYRIARMAQGGMRDAISLFELCAGQNRTIDTELVERVLGAGSRDSIATVVAAIAARHYDTIYRSIGEVIASSRDIGVFWQELIDYYRDMMVVKATSFAKDYLDLTELELHQIEENASHFSLSLLVYHTKCLEDAAMLLLRAGVSKRTVAEIALTRMCDPKLSASQESLVARIEKLEGDIAILRSGVALPRATPEKQEAVKTGEDNKATEAVSSPKPKTAQAPSDAPIFKPIPAWGDVVESVGRVRPSVLGFMESSKGYLGSDNTCLVRAKGKVASSILGREDTLSLIKNAVAELLGEDMRHAKFIIEAKEAPSSNAIIEELEDALGVNTDFIGG